jgi:hypothetical protein
MKLAWPNLRYNPGICLKIPRKATKCLSLRIVDVPAKLRTEFLPNISQKLSLGIFSFFRWGETEFTSYCGH